MRGSTFIEYISSVKYKSAHGKCHSIGARLPMQFIYASVACLGMASNTHKNRTIGKKVIEDMIDREI